MFAHDDHEELERPLGLTFELVLHALEARLEPVEALLDCSTEGALLLAHRGLLLAHRALLPAHFVHQAEQVRHGDLGRSVLGHAPDRLAPSRGGDTVRQESLRKSPPRRARATTGAVSRSFEPPPPLPLAEQHGQTFPRLVEIMQRLLAPDGCPWDREQTYDSLKRYVLEEACEVIDAVDSGDRDPLCEELGDLALQIVFLAELARRDGAFGPDDVVRSICEKLVRRHPHVFGDVAVRDARDVAQNWEAIKREEKGARPLLASIPRALPALLRAQRMSQRVARVGFDWPDPAGSRDKVAEEIRELDEATRSGAQGRIESELGDVLFALVNLARHHGVDAEQALRSTCDRFEGRFGHVEARARAAHGDWPRDARGEPARGIPLEELDRYWNEAKEAES
jgi:MazG family protein